MISIPEITDEMRAEARQQPNGYVYCIDSNYAPNGANGAVPPEGVIGAYPVDSDGNIVNDFQANPHYAGRADEQERGHSA